MEQSFKPGQTLEFSAGAFVVQEIIGQGASSIVYRVIHEDGTEHLLKEYHPKRIPMHRDENGFLQVDSEEDQSRFERGLGRFETGYMRQLEFRRDEDLKNITTNIQGIHEGYNTKFIDMTCFSGQSYDKVKEESLIDLLKRIRAITAAISCYHKKGYLHLDIKPENIFALPQTSEFVMLFDFDSVTAKKDIQKPQTMLSCTKQWAAPEQRAIDGAKHIRECTDLYAIGMVFFYKLMGRLPEDPEEHRSSAVYSFDGVELLKGANQETLALLTKIFQHTLCKATNTRWQSAEELISALDALLASITKPQISQPNKEDVSQDVNRQISKLNRTIIVAAVFVCLLIASMAIGFVFLRGEHGIAGEFTENAVPSNTQEIVSDNNEQLPAEGVASIPSADSESEAAIQTPMVSPEGTSNENNRDSDVPSDVPIPVVSENVPGYTIDTIAMELNDFRSMVMNNAGVVYYINGNTVYNSADNETLDLSSDFETKLSNSYLAYDQYNDIVYLLADGKGSSAPLLYDVTDFNGPKLVLHKDNCSDLARLRLAYASDVTPQIVVLSDGSLLVPADLDGTYRINPKTKLVTRFNSVYDLQSPYFAKVIGSDIVEMRGESTDATIIPLTGGAEYSIQLERPAPYNNGNSVCSTSRGIFFYWENVGLCKYSIAGEFEIAVEQEKIAVQDFQPLDNTNIWSITANESGWVAFYDNSLKCIRLIRCE